MNQIFNRFTTFHIWGRQDASVINTGRRVSDSAGEGYPPTGRLCLVSCTPTSAIVRRGRCYSVSLIYTCCCCWWNPPWSCALSGRWLLHRHWWSCALSGRWLLHRHSRSRRRNPARFQFTLLVRHIEFAHRAMSLNWLSQRRIWDGTPSTRGSMWAPVNF
jgi:hypothetical protein